MPTSMSGDEAAPQLLRPVGQRALARQYLALVVVDVQLLQRLRVDRAAQEDVAIALVEGRVEEPYSFVAHGSLRSSVSCFIPAAHARVRLACSTRSSSVCVNCGLRSTIS